MTALSPEQIRGAFRTHTALADRHQLRAREGGSEYGLNRSLGLIHRYLSLLGDPERQEDSFVELFSDDFELSFASAQISTVAEFSNWLASYRASTSASTLTIDAVDVVSSLDATFTVTVDFEWDGLLDDGSHMEMATRHVWLIEDNPGDRFARIKSIVVTRTRDLEVRRD